MTEYDDRDIYRTQHRQFVRFLEEAAFSLEESSVMGQSRLEANTLSYIHRSVSVVLDRLDFNLPPTHVGLRRACDV